MAERLNVVKTLKVTTSDGQPFFDATIEYHAIPYEAFLELERNEIQLLNAMTEYGERRLKPQSDR